jgi:hypothetical protein
MIVLSNSRTTRVDRVAGRRAKRWSRTMSALPSVDHLSRVLGTVYDAWLEPAPWEQ